MYLRKFIVDNIRSVSSLTMDFDKNREAGWHVLLGPNGSGKSSVVRAFALLMMGEKEAYASRQIFQTWMGDGETALIVGHLTMDEKFDSLVGGGQPPKKLINAVVSLKPSKHDSEVVEPIFSGDLVKRTIWGGGDGWFSASFGPYRRFTGGDRVYDKLFISNKRLAPHLTSLGEDVALTEALEFLTNLLADSYRNPREEGPVQGESLQKLDLIFEFINKSGLLPHGSQLNGITGSRVLVRDGRGSLVPMDQLSDGYRSVLSLALELIRQMFNLYGFDKMRKSFSGDGKSIDVPGVVVIDEIDVHLHPDWQRDIGRWLTKSFPKIQFIVTTHSPIVCRAIVDDSGEITGSVWKLPAPDSDEDFAQIQGTELEQLAFGDVLDAYGTELFGSDIARSEAGREKLERLAELNLAAKQRELSPDEKVERRNLRAIFPASSGIFESI